MDLDALFSEVSSLITANASAILCCVLTCCYLVLFLNQRPKNFPPGPIGFPIVGVAPYVGGRPEITFAEWGKQYGDVIGFKMGKDFTVVLNSYDVIQEALVKNGHVFSNRPDNFIITDVMHKKGISMNDYTESYVKERKFAAGSLSKLGFGKTKLENTILEQSRNFVDYFRDKDFELTSANKRTLMNAIGNVICQLLLGQSYDFEDPEFLEISEAFIEFFRKGALAYQMTIILPWIHHFPPILGSAKCIRKGFATVDRIMAKKIEEHEATIDKENPRDFVDEYLLEMKKNGDPKKNLYSKKMLICMGRDLFGAGMETVQGTIIYTLLILANRPEVQKRMHDEIDEALGSEGIPWYATREKMPYCHAALKEVMRFKTVGPLTIAHCTSEDVVLKGYNIPKGTTILPNLYAVHNDPDNWEKPELFMPERHLDDKGKVNVTKYFVPFSVGPRLCIGRRLAEVEVFIFIITILQKFTVVPTPTPECERPYVVEDVSKTGLVMVPPHSTPVTLKHR